LNGKIKGEIFLKIDVGVLDPLDVGSLLDLLLSSIFDSMLPLSEHWLPPLPPSASIMEFSARIFVTLDETFDAYKEHEYTSLVC
jgi:hypothetical protein